MATGAPFAYLKFGADLLGIAEQMRGLRQQSSEARINAKIETLNAKMQENDLRDQLVRTLASNAAATAASGVYGPSIGAAAADDITEASRTIEGVSLAGRLRAGALRRQSRELRRQATLAPIIGVANAGFDLYGNLKPIEQGKRGG